MSFTTKTLLKTLRSHWLLAVLGLGLIAGIVFSSSLNLKGFSRLKSDVTFEECSTGSGDGKKVDDVNLCLKNLNCYVNQDYTKMKGYLKALLIEQKRLINVRASVTKRCHANQDWICSAGAKIEEEILRNGQNVDKIYAKCNISLSCKEMQAVYGKAPGDPECPSEEDPTKASQYNPGAPSPGEPWGQ